MIPTTSSTQVQKVNKVRRTRQPRNPQLSVARRNERERNRVKMVNNGFALLREHLPIDETLVAGSEHSGSDTPTPDGQKSGKAKKFSKVETLRAAIQHIKMLTELIRSEEPNFESININSTGSAQYASAYDDEPLSVGEPASCSSSQSNSTGALNTVQHHYQYQQQQQIYHHLDSASQQEQFVKLEPAQMNPISHPSPQNSPMSQHSNSLSLNINLNRQPPHNHLHQQQQQQLYTNTTNSQQATQVHLNKPSLNHLSNHLQEPSHTHLWIQQHQSSFMEQQQLQYQMSAPTSVNQWYAQQQQHEQQQVSETLSPSAAAAAATTPTTIATNDNKNGWFVQQSESPKHQMSNNGAGQQQQQMHSIHQQLEQQQQQHSPAWLSNSPSNLVGGQSQPMPTFNHHHHQHQISLYSQ